MKRIRKKLRGSGGLTLVEMLCGVVILILLGLVLNTGLNIAVKSYHNMTAEAETQLLLSTLVDAISDKVRYTTVSPSGGTYDPPVEITFDGGTEGQVLVDGKRLLPDGAYGKGKYVAKGIGTGGLLTYAGDANKGCFILHLTVKEKSGDISASAEVAIRCLNPPPEEEAPEGPAPGG